MIQGVAKLEAELTNLAAKDGKVYKQASHLTGIIAAHYFFAKRGIQTHFHQGTTNNYFNPVSGNSVVQGMQNIAAASVLPALQYILQQNNIQRLQTLLADSERAKHVKKLTEANLQNRFLKRQENKFQTELRLQWTEDRNQNIYLLGDVRDAQSAKFGIDFH